MTTAARVRLWIAVAMLIVGITIPLMHGQWLKTRIFKPVDKPITLSKGHLTTGDFNINLPGTYRGEISIDDEFFYLAPNPSCHVYGADSVMKYRWKVFRNGEYLAGRDKETYYDFQFDAEKPGLYRLDIDMFSDPACANAGHPRIRVHTWSGEHEDRQFNLSWMGFFSVLGAFGLSAHAVIFSIRDRQLVRERTATVLEPQDARLTPPIRRFPSMPRMVGLPAFGTIVPMFLLCILVIFIADEMNRPVPKGLWVSLSKHIPATVYNSPPPTLYIGRSDHDSLPPLYLNGNQVAWDHLEATLKNELKTRADWIVYIDANPDLPFADIASAIDLIHRMHAKAVLVTSRDPSPEMMAHYDSKRCSPRIEKQSPSTIDDEVRLRKGEKVPESPVVAYEVLESGETSNLHLERSSGNEELDKHALDWVRRMKFNRRPGCGVIESKVSVMTHWQ
jgi:TonB family protein